LADPSGNPETNIYDDIGVAINKEANTAPSDPEKKSHVWWKRISLEDGK
jgi:hypothetical protein